MRWAAQVHPWEDVLKDVVRRDNEAGEARRVRVTVDETEEYGFRLQHACVAFDWAPEPNAPAQVPPVYLKHAGAWRRGPQTQKEGACAIIGDRGGYYHPRSQRRDR